MRRKKEEGFVNVNVNLNERMNRPSHTLNTFNRAVGDNRPYQAVNGCPDQVGADEDELEVRR